MNEASCARYYEAKHETPGPPGRHSIRRRGAVAQGRAAGKDAYLGYYRAIIADSPTADAGRDHAVMETGPRRWCEKITTLHTRNESPIS